MEPKRVLAGPDRLSSLPAELRDEILVRLDLRDAVRTSVLSRTWRHLWKSLSVLSLSFPFGTHPSVVDSVLLPYIGPRVSLFDICVDDESAGRIDDWFAALSRCRVESIHMCGRLRSGYFNLHSSIFSFGDLVSLRLRCCNIPPLPHERDFGDFLARFAHVQKLSLFSPADDVKMPYTLPFTFYNLKNLMLSMDFTEMRPILFMFTLLRSCDNLQKLEIESRDVFGQGFEADWEFLNALWTDGMCASLQIVQMSRVIWLPNEILLMKLILSKARLLRTLYVDTHPDDFDDPIIDLLKCKRASAQARVLFEGLAQQY
ncbi:hypothetical protein SORBI_3009G233600 [Sorghum bicolor]|uniref:F-box domain-containing protein n=1 Tax=Sorghum bicolor TaxID=4558 RepID=A0A1Z5R4F7_SORBI|nr:hypothetical protein SORBI_3009G233600 [Sorghum bicolor]